MPIVVEGWHAYRLSTHTYFTLLIPFSPFAVLGFDSCIMRFFPRVFCVLGVCGFWSAWLANGITLVEENSLDLNALGMAKVVENGTFLSTFYVHYEPL